jgi:hypothetical protein
VSYGRRVTETPKDPAKIQDRIAELEGQLWPDLPPHDEAVAIVQEVRRLWLEFLDAIGPLATEPLSLNANRPPTRRPGAGADG